MRRSLAALLVIVLLLLNVGPAFAQSVLQIPVGPASHEELYVEIESTNHYDSAYVSGGVATFYNVPLFESFTVRADPSYTSESQSMYGWDNGLYCATSDSFQISSPGIDCDVYDSFSDTCTLDLLTLDLADSNESMQVLIRTAELNLSSVSAQGVGDPVPYASVYFNLINSNSYYGYSVETGADGVANLPGCGVLQPQDVIEVYIYHPDHLYWSDSYTLASPISSTLSVIDLPGGTNASLTIELVDKDGNQFTVPQSETYSDVSCNPASESYYNLPGPYAQIDPGESSVTLQTYGATSPGSINWLCTFFSDNYSAQEGSVSLSEGQSKTLQLTVLEPLDVNLTLRDDQGFPVVVPVYIDFSGAEKNGVWLNHFNSASMGQGVDATTISLLDGGFYESYISQDFANTGNSSLNPNQRHYLFLANKAQEVSIGQNAAAGEVSSLDLIIPTTSSTVSVSASAPSGPLQWAFVDLNCYDPEEGAPEQNNSPFDYFGGFGGSTDENGTGLFPVPEGQSCDVNILSPYDPNGQKLLSANGRVTLDSIAANASLSANFSFVPADYFLTVNLEFPEGVEVSSENTFAYCDARSADGKTTWGDIYESQVPNQLQLGFLANPKEVWQIYCFADNYDPTNPILGDFYESYSSYIVKSGTNTDTQLISFIKRPASTRFAEEYSFKNKGEAVLTFNFGEIRVPAQAFGSSGTTYLSLSTIASEAKNARPSGGKYYTNAPMSFTFKNSEGEKVQPEKPVTLRIFLDQTRIEEIFGADVTQVIVAHLNSSTGLWEESESELKVDSQGRFYVEASAKKFSVWSDLIDTAKKPQEKKLDDGSGGDSGSGDGSSDGSSSTEKEKLGTLRQKKVRKSKGKKVRYTLSCEDERPGIYEFRVRAVKSKKKKKKKKKKKNNTESSSDPWEGIEPQASDSCELRKKFKKGKKYFWSVRFNNNSWSDDKKLKVKNK